MNDCSPFVRQYRPLEELVHLDLAPHRVTQERGCGARRGRGNGNNITKHREWLKVAAEVADATIRLWLRFLNGLHATFSEKLGSSSVPPAYATAEEACTHVAGRRRAIMPCVSSAGDMRSMAEIGRRSILGQVPRVLQGYRTRPGRQARTASTSRACPRIYETISRSPSSKSSRYGSTRTTRPSWSGQFSSSAAFLNSSRRLAMNNRKSWGISAFHCFQYLPASVSCERQAKLRHVRAKQSSSTVRVLSQGYLGQALMMPCPFHAYDPVPAKCFDVAVCLVKSMQAHPAANQICGMPQIFRL